MDEHNRNPAKDEPLDHTPETPEDVAVLYTWANVHGGKYRDFSASRREFRAQQRHRMVEAQRQAELEAARAREEAAARELAEARRREEESEHDTVSRAEAEEALRRAESYAEQERMEARRHVEVAEDLKRAMEEAQLELEEARRRAEEQAARYAEADARSRASTPQEHLPGEINDPYYYAGPLEPTAFAPGKGVRSSVPQRVSSERRIVESYHRSRGSGEIAAARGEDASSAYGIFSSGQRRREYSGSHAAYTESQAAPLHFASERVEIPEDARERRRVDELERLPGRHADHRSGDDGYYDHAPRRSAPPVERSAPSPSEQAADDLHIPPRVQQARPDFGSGERRVPRAGDPAPGNSHALDFARLRRRESAADVTARTSRRPRESGAMPAAIDSREVASSGRNHTGDQIGAEDHGRASSQEAQRFQRRAGESRSEDAPAQDRGDGQRMDRRQPPRGLQADASARPEWLVRENPSFAEERAAKDLPGYPSVKDSVQSRESRIGEEPRPVRKEQRRLRSGSDSPFLPAADGGFNLPPLPRDATSSLQGGYGAPKSMPQAMEQRGEESALRSEPPLPSRPQMDRRRSDRAATDSTMREVRTAGQIFGEQELQDRRRTSVSAPQREEAQPERPSQLRPSDSLQQSRERVAARWFALKSLMREEGESSAEMPAVLRTKEMPAAILAVVSLSGGVGKTSMVATVGRALSSVGERVLLVDATTHGLLPYYFGARELRPDTVRTFSPPPGRKDAPVFLVNYEAERLSHDEPGQLQLLEELARHAAGTQRVLLDLNGGSAWLARRLAAHHARILVPIAPDMNSVLGIKSVERFFSGAQDAEGRPVQPSYILNQFDASLPLHLDVREVLRQQLGDRLLPVMIRRSPAVAEALAEGMTVLDYAPESPVTEDYVHLAEWARSLAAPAQAGMRNIRWSER